jgi:hypothetical protein
MKFLKLRACILVVSALVFGVQDFGSLSYAAPSEVLTYFSEQPPRLNDGEVKKDYTRTYPDYSCAQYDQGNIFYQPYGIYGQRLCYTPSPCGSGYIVTENEVSSDGTVVGNDQRSSLRISRFLCDSGFETSGTRFAMFCFNAN